MTQINWSDLAACRAPGVDPRDFHADREDFDATTRARLLCRSCPVQLDCGLQAVADRETHGVIRAGYEWRDGKPYPLKKCRVCDRWTGRTHCSPACAAVTWAKRRCVSCRQPLTHRRIIRYCDPCAAAAGIHAPARRRKKVAR